MKPLFFLIFIGLAAHYFTACTKGGNQASVNENTYTVSSQLSSKKVFPALATDTSNGVFSGWYDESLNILTFRFAYVKDTSVSKLDTLRIIRFFRTATTANDTASAVRRFFISTSINAASRTNITGAFNFGLSGNNAFSVDEKAGFLLGSWYAVLYSSRFPNGLIGGPLGVTKNP